MVTSPKSRQALKAETRERIVRAARRILTHEGFEAFTMRRVAKEANIAQPSFYTHFDSLDQLLSLIASDLRQNYIDPQARAMMNLASSDLKSDLPTVIYNFMRVAFDTAISFPNIFCMTVSQRSLQNSNYGKIIHQEFEHVKSMYIQFFQLIAEQAGVKIPTKKVAMGVDAILGSNEALIMGCIEGRYAKREEAVAMATDIILNQIYSSINSEKEQTPSL